MAANLPSPIGEIQATEVRRNLAGVAKAWADRLVMDGVDRDIARREISFALAHLAAEYGLDPTGRR